MNSDRSLIQNFVFELFDNMHEVEITPQLAEIFKQMLTNKKEKSQIESCMTDYWVCDNEALRDVITAFENFFDCVIIKEVKKEKKMFGFILEVWEDFENILDVIYYHLHRINQVPQAERFLIKTNSIVLFA